MNMLFYIAEENADWQFWMDWLIQFFTAIGTIGAVVVALFFNDIRAKWFPPELVLEIKDKVGTQAIDIAEVEETGPFGQIVVHKVNLPARYFHLKVRNTRRWIPFTEVQVYIVQMKGEAKSGTSIDWQGEIPLKWPYQSSGVELKRPIGPESLCDFFKIVDLKGAGLHPNEQKLATLHFTPRIRIANPVFDYEEPFCVDVSLVAKGIQADSKMLRIRIRWNGHCDKIEIENLDDVRLGEGGSL